MKSGGGGPRPSAPTGGWGFSHWDHSDAETLNSRSLTLICFHFQWCEPRGFGVIKAIYLCEREEGGSGALGFIWLWGRELVRLQEGSEAADLFINMEQIRRESWPHSDWELWPEPASVFACCSMAAHTLCMCVLIVCIVLLHCIYVWICVFGCTTYERLCL